MDIHTKNKLALIREEIINLANEALHIIRRESPHEAEVAKAYYIGHVLAAMDDGNHGSPHETTLLKYLKTLGYDEDTDSFPDESDGDGPDVGEEDDNQK